MKSKLKILLAVVAMLTTIISCSKNNDEPNGPANTATAASSNLTLSNRVVAAFVIDSSSLRAIPTGTLPTSGYNKFRKQLTYDTLTSANKPKVYKVGDTVTILAYVKGDDYSIGKRGLYFRFFQVPTAFSSATSFIKPTALFPIQSAEDSIRNFAPRTVDVLSQVSFATIAPTSSDSLKVSALAGENVNGIKYSTYLVQYNYIIPAALSGKLISVNFTVSTALRNDLGNVNWIYAFYVR
jgi:hypothetical protein